MIIAEETRCKTCERIFCCAMCREKHEYTAHGIIVQCSEPVLRLLCPICEKRPLVLHEVIHSELLKHIFLKHLPLHCRKCSKVYAEIDDFRLFSKCKQTNDSCNLEGEMVSPTKSDGGKSRGSADSGSNASTQTSPYRDPDMSDSRMSPMFMMNLHWQAKSKITEEFSVSSIKNISCMNSSVRKSVGLGRPLIRGKLVRSTSTPLQAEIFARAKERVFNVSNRHISSIHNSASESENSPPLLPPAKPVEPINRYQKPRGRGKLSSAVTPLRHVMSKSIQKAIAEHAIAAENRGFGYNRKKIFESIDSSNDMLEKSAENLPIDLRLSPALRRTQSEILDRQSRKEFVETISKATPAVKILLSSTKKTETTTESIVITSSTPPESVTENDNKSTNQSGNSVYKSCQSVEIITQHSTTELSQLKMEENKVVYQNECLAVPPITPRIPTSGVLTNKKIIKFETPKDNEKTFRSENESSDEVFYTPSSTPIRTSRIKKKNIDYNKNFNEETKENHDFTNTAIDDEVFVEEKKPNSSRSRLWNMVASVMRLPSLNTVTEQDTKKSIINDTDVYNSTSLIGRCASFAGSLVRRKPLDDDIKAVKRKRTYTSDFNLAKGNQNDFDFACSDPKRLRIYGRKPINRMQQLI